MQLFHFTSPHRLPSIRETGIYIGDVPIRRGAGFNSPWMTRDPRPDHQWWTAEAGVDKTLGRITVEVPANDPRLHRWCVLARRFNVKKNIFTTAVGWENWYVYENHVPVEWFTAIQEPEGPLPTLARVLLQSRLFVREAPFGLVTPRSPVRRCSIWDAPTQRFVEVGLTPPQGNGVYPMWHPTYGHEVRKLIIADSVRP